MNTPIKSLEFNTYGNLDRMPKGWVESPARLQKLKKHKIPTYKCFLKWNQSGRHFSPVLVNVIRRSDLKKVNAFLEAEQAEQVK